MRDNLNTLGVTDTGQEEQIQNFRSIEGDFPSVVTEFKNVASEFAFGAGGETLQRDVEKSSVDEALLGREQIKRLEHAKPGIMQAICATTEERQIKQPGPELMRRRKRPSVIRGIVNAIRLGLGIPKHP